MLPEQVVVHPLVLLSIVDHYKRVAPSPGKRVVGVLLGYWSGSLVHVSNSYALPFEENEADATVWFLDHNYHENMAELYKKINAKERPVGWYHTGPKLRSSDLKINALFKKFSANPVLVVVDPEPAGAEHGLPFNAYVAVDEIREDGIATSQTFTHISSGIEAEEAEEIGVEHLLRDVKELAVGNVGQQVTAKIKSLQALERQLGVLEAYVEKILARQLPYNHAINHALQDMLNLLPDIQTPAAQRALTVSTNDQLMMVFVGTLMRALLVLHSLVDNKLEALVPALPIKQ